MTPTNHNTYVFMYLTYLPTIYIYTPTQTEQQAELSKLVVLHI